MSGQEKGGSSFLRDWWKVFCILLVLYLALAGILYVSQHGIIYKPATQVLPPPAEMGLAAMRAVTTKTEDGLGLVAWYAPPKEPAKPVVLVFHGNAGSIANRRHIAEVFLKHGYGVFLAEYRGYAGNPGEPGEEGLYKDARAAAAWLAQNGHAPKHIAVYGESVGSGVAVQLAAEIQPAYLILHSPFSSLVDVALNHFTVMPARLMVKDKYESDLKIGRIGAPLLVVHGDRDKLIPDSIGRRLFDKANEPKTFITIPGAGHNDMYQYGVGEKIIAWLEAQVSAGREERKSGEQ